MDVEYIDRTVEAVPYCGGISNSNKNVFKKNKGGFTRS